MGLAPSPFKLMLIGHMWEWLTPTLISALCYGSGSIAILLFARFYLGTEFVKGFCLGGAVVFTCAVVSALHRGYRESKRQSDEISALLMASLIGTHNDSRLRSQ
jgi:hypothetical protein